MSTTKRVLHCCLDIPRSERGSMLIVTMGIMIVLSGLALVFSREMRVEVLASSNLVTAAQADAITSGASQYVINRLAHNTDRTLLDTEIKSEAVQIGEGQFWIVRPNADDERRSGYGVVDESAKLNINTATYDMLLRLPGMSSELAASIVDWRDEDENVSEGGGAESAYYLLQLEPYQCKNGPFETIDELLLVKGGTRQVLFGVDSNRNGVVDESESGGAQLSGFNGQTQCGVSKYLTVYSIEPNTSGTGQPRVYVGDTRTNTLAALAVVLSRSLPVERVTAITTRLRGGPPPTSVLDFYQKSGMTLDEFKPVSDLITTDRAPVLPGHININTAPREVLRCLPGLDDADVDLIIAKRSLSGPDLENISWVAEALSPAKASQVGNFITARSYQFSADIVGISGNGRGFKRMMYVFDVRTTPRRTILCKNLTHLGWPLEEGLRERLRSGSDSNSNKSSFAKVRR